MSSSVDGGGSLRSFDTARDSKTPYLQRLRRQLTFQVLLEYAIAATFVLLCLSLSAYRVSQENIQSLVPYSSLSSCSSYSEVYSLVPQSVQIKYPGTMSFVDYGSGDVFPGYANVTFTANWTSCFLESTDNNFGLAPETDAYYQQVNFTFAAAAHESVNGTASTNNGCFQLYCGYEYTYNSNNLSRVTNYEPFLRDSIFLLVPLDANVAVNLNNGTGGSFTDNQLITSISGTDNSVTAACSVSIGGYYQQIFTQSNSVTTTGTYLCTQSTPTLQAVSSGLSIALTAMGLCRLYYYGKSKNA